MWSILKVEPHKDPYVKEISEDLESLQAEVGGYMEVVYPFDDPVALVCNEEGKLNGLPTNRALYNKYGVLTDVIFGDFFIVGLGEEDFDSLPPELAAKYTKEFSI